MAEYFGVAKEKGVTSRELEAVQAIVMAVAGGRVRAQLQDARRRESVQSTKDE
jgi:hypothetical protein